MSVTRDGSSALPTIEGYHVQEEIGAGGFSRVYRARQLSVGRDVALKVLDSEFSDDAQRRAFEHECQVMGRLTHPNIVRVYDSATTSDGRGCIVMELYAGTYRDEGHLTIPDVIDVGVKIAEALDEAHQIDVVHHDLKPHNLFKSARGEPALGDFGISTIAGRQTGTTRLTLRYAPPELLRDGRSDAKGDIYSLGATLYQLATGEPPFAADTDEALIHKIMVEPPPRLARSDAPAPLDMLLRRCLAKDPEQRPASAGEVADELRRIQSVVGLPIRSRGGRAPGASYAPAQRAARDEGADLTSDDVALGRATSPRPRRTDEPDAAAPTPTSHRRLIAMFTAAIVVLVGAALTVAFAGGGGDDTATTTTVARTVPPFVVITPPSELTVRVTDGGFRFTWTLDDPQASVQLHRTGTDDNVIAERSPFVWDLDGLTSGNCFEARTVSPDGRGMSQAKSGPVCA